MEQQPSYQPTIELRPGGITALGITTLVSGVINIFYGLIVAVMIILGTFFVGLVCLPFLALPIILGVFEMIYGLKLLATPPQPVKPYQTLAVMEICCIVTGNVISLIAGILALVMYNDRAVIEYFARMKPRA